jgi:hypothetical protein
LGRNDYKRYLRNPISFLEDVSMVGEMPTRLGVFERAQKKTSDLEAALESREASVDFARRGAKMKAISALYTFFNARLQGAEKLFRSFKERPTKTLLKVGALAVIPSIITYLINRDDDKYWEIPAWQRALFWIIPIKGRYMRIPKGDVGVLFGTTTEMILNFIDKDKAGKYKLNDLAGSIIGESFPVSDVGGFLPVAFRVPVELFSNKSFFTSRPIVTPGKEALEPRYQYSPFTSETAKLIGRTFNISPSKIEHLVTGYAAGLGRYALKLNDGMLSEMGILEKKAERPKELADIPVVKAFVVRDPLGFESESVSKFYDALAKIERFGATAKMLIKGAKPEAAKELISQRKVQSLVYAHGLDKEFIKTRDDLSSLRKIKEQILENKELTVDEKKKVIDDIHNLVMAMVITTMSRYRALEQMAKEK